MVLPNPITTFNQNWPNNHIINSTGSINASPYSRPYDIIANNPETTSGAPQSYIKGGKMRTYRKRMSRFKRRIKQRKTKKNKDKKNKK